MPKQSLRKLKPYSPPSCCRRCGEQMYMGIRHVCVEHRYVENPVKNRPLLSLFTIIDPSDHPEGPWEDMSWVLAERTIRRLNPILHDKQIYDILYKAKGKTDSGSSQT